MKAFARAAVMAVTFAACSSNQQSGSNTGGSADAGSAGLSTGVGGNTNMAGAKASGGSSGGGGDTSAASGHGGSGEQGGTSSAGAAGGGQSGSTSVGGAGGHGGAGGGGGAGQAGGGNGGGPSGSSAGCGTSIVRPSLTAQQTMDVGGTMRTYLLEVPSAADNKTPLALIFALHGANMTNTQVVGSYNFGTLSGGKAIAVYPQGDQTASGARWTSNEANWTYLQSLMTDLQGRYCIDKSKVFLTGFSMGGGFTMDTACQKSTMFRAFATVEGYGPGGVMAATTPACTNANAKAPLLIIQGSTDTTVTPAMGQASLAFWTGKNGCSATTSMPMGQGFSSCTANEDCTSAFPVYYCTGTWNHTITSTASADVWAFFSTFK